MALALGTRAAAAGHRLIAFDKVGSTNAEAMAHARQGVRPHAPLMVKEFDANLAVLAKVVSGAVLPQVGFVFARPVVGPRFR
jgi:hypothetical protein